MRDAQRPRAERVMAMGARPVAVILGAQGTLGAALTAGLPAAGWEVAVAATRADCDITDTGAVRGLLARVRPTAVFNAAAYTDVDRAESEPERAHAVNAAAPGDCGGRRGGRRGRRPLFDGLRLRRHPGAPLRRARPAVAAGALRAVEGCGRPARRGGESAALHPARRLPVRTRGPQLSLDDRAAAARGRDDPRRQGSRRLTDVGARGRRGLGGAGPADHFGLYHCTAHGETTWADFARLAATLVGAPAERVQGVAYADLKLKAPRPLHAVLDNRALREVGLDTMSSWQDSLRAFVAAERGRGLRASVAPLALLATGWRAGCRRRCARRPCPARRSW